ncbi:MAG: maleylpyruvate isomerase family mycothiol-dependent enzyme [Mycobacterium sp.]
MGDISPGDRVGALRRERAELIRFCRELDDAQWRTPSMAAGWRVQDVVAHMGAGCHSIFTPASLKILRSNEIERANDALVDVRRSWLPTQTLAEYERWSRILTTAAQAISPTPLANLRMPLAELGKFPAGLLLAGAMTFDHHTHLRHDIAPALGLPAPDTDAARMTVVLEWMFAVLSNQLRAARPGWLEHPIGITLRGPGGGSWVIDAHGAVPGRHDDAAAAIVGGAAEFPEWGTRRADWRSRDVRISGDVDYGARFLDLVNIV